MSNAQKIIDLYKEGKVSDTTMLKMAAFKEELQIFLNSEGFEKTAADLAKGILLGALIAPTLAASNYLVGKGLDILEKDKSQNKNEELYRRMLELRPELKSEDPLLVRKYWDSLIHFAPSIAQDPLAAGAYIKQSIQYEEVGGPPYSTIESLVKTHKTYRDANPFGSRTVGEVVAENASKFKI